MNGIIGFFDLFNDESLSRREPAADDFLVCVSGIGLGLSISKAYAKKLGDDISIKSQNKKVLYLYFIFLLFVS